MSKELTVKSTNEVSGFIEQAIKQNLPVETMEKLFALHEKVKAGQAKEAFTHAMAEFQKAIPVIEKTKQVKNKDGTLRYQYAPLEVIIKQIKTPLADNGLSFTWEVENKEGFIKAFAKVTHIFGHSEVSSFEVPIDKGGFMTSPQQFASALTFAKRYALCNVLGLSTSEEDTDATDVNKEKTAKSVKARIVFLLRQLKEKVGTKAECEEAVTRLTQLALVESNHSEIVARLNIITSEKQEYDTTQAK